jgi:hypothetical protein
MNSKNKFPKNPKIEIQNSFFHSNFHFSPLYSRDDYVCIGASFYICWYFLSEYKTHCVHSLSCLIINPHTLLNMDENLKQKKHWTLSLQFKSKLIFWTIWSYKIFEPSFTNRNWPKCNHSIYDMRLLVICNYIWTFLQLFLVLVIFATTLQLVCNYFGVHPSMW